MKKYLIFLLLLLVSVGASAVTIDLTFGTRTKTEESLEWYYQDVTDAQSIQVGDFIVVSHDEVEADNTCQYAICTTKGDKLVRPSDKQDWYDCSTGDKDFDFTITQDIYEKIQHDGLQIQDKGLSNLKIKILRIAEDWSQYKPTVECTEIMSTPQYISDWYNEGFVLKTSNDYVGKTLRVVCLETADDSYAFLKKNTSGWPSLMSGSDKFSIAGWKYFEIKINDELNNLLKGDGLRIGGNNYYIAGIYVYGSDTTAPAWADEEDDVIDTCLLYTSDAADEYACV